jgi:hypothetical protein
MAVDARNNFSIIRAQLSNQSFTEGLLEGAKDIVDLASQLAPKDTGELSRSGKAEVIGKGKVEVSFGNGLSDDRALSQEFGTVFQPAQPYLFPAIRSVDILFHVKEALKL